MVNEANGALSHKAQFVPLASPAPRPLKNTMDQMLQIRSIQFLLDS